MTTAARTTAPSTAPSTAPTTAPSTAPSPSTSAAPSPPGPVGSPGPTRAGHPSGHAGANPSSVRVLVPTGMLGSGFPPESIAHGLAMGADTIAVDAGSTDSGPHYLGTGTAKTSPAALRRDLRVLLTAACAAGIPLIVTSCGTCGTDSGVDATAAIVASIAEQHRLSFRLASLYTEQTAETLRAALDSGRIRPLTPPGPLDMDLLRSCSHIVGVLGREPIADALEAGAQVILTGRATDTAAVAALALLREVPAGAAWHAAKIVECGGHCTTNPLTGVMATLDATGFTIESLDPASAATPASVAAHMLYENAHPFRMREPSGTLDTSHAVYRALDERRVRVEGSRFEPAAQYTIKLEGSAPTGYETLSLVGIRDPKILRAFPLWRTRLLAELHERAGSLLELAPPDYQIALRCFGDDAVLGRLEPRSDEPREVGVLLKVRAATQDTATSIAKLANPLLLHLPLPGMDALPSFAFATSPAEVERGPVYEFMLNHAVDVDTPHALCRTTYREITHD